MLKRLSNFGEQKVYDEIADAAGQYRAHIYRKVRIADVVELQGLSDRVLGTYALQAHLDFCVCDDKHVPQFAIEYDGGGHDPRNDSKKNRIAADANLALFRIDETLLNRTRGGITFLQYLVHTYFMGQAFLEMQERGNLAPDEPFMMSSFLKPDAKHVFDSDFDFSGPARNRINRIMRRAGAAGGPLYHLDMSGVIFGRSDSSFIGFASIPIGNRFAFGRARLDIGTPCLGRLGELPFGWSALADYCEGMIFEDLGDELETYLGSGAHVARTREQVDAEVKELSALDYASLRGFGGKDAALMGYVFSKR